MNKIRKWWMGVKIELAETFKVRIPRWWRKLLRDIITVLTYQPGRGDGDGKWR